MRSRVGRRFSLDGVPGRPCHTQATAGERVAFEKYSYNGTNALADYDMNNNATARYAMNGVDGLLYVQRGMKKYFYHTNHLGSVVAITDEDGDVVNRYLYTDSWGNFKLSCPSVNKGKPCIPNRYIYTGREWDADLDLYYYRARFYDPDTKRFTQEDPVFESTNRYMYVDNNPMVNTDPSGATGQSPVVGAAGGLILVYMLFSIFKYFNNGLKKSDPNTKRERQDVVVDSKITDEEFVDMQKADVDYAEGAVDFTKAAATANGGYADGIVGLLCEIGISMFCNPDPPCGEE